MLFYGFVVLLFCDFVVLWFCGFVMKYNYCTVVLWNYKYVRLWFCGFVEEWNCYMVVSLLCGRTNNLFRVISLWFCGFVIMWFDGVLCACYAVDYLCVVLEICIILISLFFEKILVQLQWSFLLLSYGQLILSRVF